MPASSPYFAIDTALFSAFTGYPSLVPLIPGNAMQFFDRSVETRGDVEDAWTIGKRLWVKPINSDDRWQWSSSAAKYSLAWIVGVGSGDIKIEESRLLLWHVDEALRLLYMSKKGDGSPLGDIGCNPLVLERFIPGDAARPREPWEEEPEWVFERTVRAIVLNPLHR